MKRLTCEMCGSTDLIKDQGVFICQSCGCKYTVEEAKKMMIDGTVEVTGTVKVDNSERIEKTRINARRSFQDKKYSDAQRYYEQILEENPDDEEAIFYSSISKGWCGSDIKTNLMAPVLKSATRALTIAKDKKSKEEYTEFAVETANEVTVLWRTIEIVFDKKLNELFSAKNSKDFPVTLRSTYDTHINQLSGLCIQSRKDAFSVVDMATQIVLDSNTQNYKLYDALIDANSYYLRYVGTQDLSNEYTEKLKNKSGIEKRHAKEKYWFENGELARTLNEEKDGLKNQIEKKQQERDEIEKRIKEENRTVPEQNPERKEFYSIEKTIRDLQVRASSLGLFKGKEKKQIEVEIETLRAKSNELRIIAEEKEAHVLEEKRKVQEELKLKKKGIEDEIKRLSERIIEIDEEFKKDR